MDRKRKNKILVLVEGEKRDVTVINGLFKKFNLADEYEIVSYCTNIYVLYNSLFGKDDDASTLDLLQVLKEKEKDESEKQKFNQSFTDIYLIFDFDPHDDQYSADKIYKMQEYFNESTDNGKLYLNYPMIEAFYHISCIPDKDFLTKTATMQELKQYKQRVGKECYCNYRNFMDSIADLSMVIWHNFEKAYYMQYKKSIELNHDNLEKILIDFQNILSKQVKIWSVHKSVNVLSTCCLIIWEYNPKLVLNEIRTS